MSSAKGSNEGGKTTLTLLAIFCLMGASTAQAAQSYTFQQIGTFGGSASWAHAINNSGQVVGEALNKNGLSRAFLWENGKMTDLGTLGGNQSAAHDINDAGQIVGWAETATGHRHAFLWENGTMTDLGTLTGPTSEANAINNSGQVVGQADTDQLDELGSPIRHAFLWENDVITDLGTLDSGESLAADINDDGTVVGTAQTGELNEFGLPATHVVIWENGQIKDLGIDGTAGGINNAGQIVGTTPVLTLTVFGVTTGSVPFARQNGQTTTLDAYPDFLGTGSEANAVNNPGTIVGRSNYSAVLWTGGVLTNLNSLIPDDRDKDLTSAADINDAGQIVGSVDTDLNTLDGTRGFLLTPTDNADGNVNQDIQDALAAACSLPAVLLITACITAFTCLGSPRKIS